MFVAAHTNTDLLSPSASPPPPSSQDYEGFSEAKAWDLLAAVSLDESDMQRLSEQLFGDSGEPVGAGLSIGGHAQAQAAAQAATAQVAAAQAARGDGVKAAGSKQASLVAACS
jgi:hypothetical protein